LGVEQTGGGRKGGGAKSKDRNSVRDKSLMVKIAAGAKLATRPPPGDAPHEISWLKGERKDP